MTLDRSELLELECRVRFVKLAASQDPAMEAIDLFIEGFWERVRAAFHPRSQERLESILAKYRAKQET